MKLYITYSTRYITFLLEQLIIIQIFPNLTKTGDTPPCLQKSSTAANPEPVQSCSHY
jgi:hypothetical protein